jgi:hypothetical protein
VICKKRTFFWLVAAILLASGLLRLYRIDAPLVDCFWDKQVAVANRARNMAGPPFDPWHAAFDFCITMDGKREPYTEEFPLYHGLVAVGYRLFGEQDWFGRALTAAGSLVAILAFIGLMRREHGERFALLAGVLFAFCPMMVFYGRTVIPDVWMLGCMLGSAYFFRVALEDDDGGGRTWAALLASGLMGMLAAAFKYYGLMVLLPMAEMAWRSGANYRNGTACRQAVAHGRRRGFVLLCLPAVMMFVPTVAWMGFVFLQTANPSQGGKYFFFQEPGVLTNPELWKRLADRFLWKSCGPVTTVLLVIGMLGTIWDGIRRDKMDSPIFAETKTGTVPKAGPIIAWTVMGLAFFFLLAPKSLGHEYYELMMLPAGAAWAALGLCFLLDRQAGKPAARARQIAIGGAVLCAAVVVHSPWIRGGRFQQDIGFVKAAESVERHCSPSGRVAVGPMTPQAVIHYAHREGWTWEEFPQDWRSLFARYRELGAECIVLYFDHKTPDRRERERYVPILQTMPILEHAAGPWGRGGKPCEYYILGLRNSGRL